MPAVFHQLLAGAECGDAITNNALRISSIINNIGGKSLVYSSSVIPRELKSDILPLNEFSSSVSCGDVLFYHFSIGSAATEIYKKTDKVKKILCYHNITPAVYFLPYSDPIASLLREGKRELESLVLITESAIADSKYNCSELTALGFKHPKVVPLCVRKELKSGKASPALLNKLQDGKVNILFVGRMVPNKKIEDIINVFSFYHHTVNPESRLILAGDCKTVPRYFDMLKKLPDMYRIKDAVLFTGRISDSDLSACYQSSHIFLCLSEHEGFCLPLIEAMNYGLPVIARSFAAVPEILGDTGVHIGAGADSRHIAEIINYVLSDINCYKQISEKQKKRLEYFSDDRFLHNITELYNFSLKGT